jgi:hypothetical protein
MKMKYSAKYLRESNLRSKRLQAQASLSDRKTKSQNLAKQGIVEEPSEILRDFEADNQDETFQLGEAQKNTVKLIDDVNQANILLNKLRESDLLNRFNRQFPRIYREIKTRFGKIGGNKAFNEIVALLEEKNRPVTGQHFSTAIQELVSELRSAMKGNTPASVAKMQDDILKLQAAAQVHNQMSPIAQPDFEATFGDTVHSITGAVDAGLLEDVMSAAPSTPQVQQPNASGVQLPQNLKRIDRSELESILVFLAQIRSGAAIKRSIVDFADTYLDKPLRIKDTKSTLQREVLSTWQELEPKLEQQLQVNISYDADNEQFDILG